MSFTKILIKFIGSSAAGNVISASALDPEIMIPVGYGGTLTESMRGRYNHFFHHRNLRTVMTDLVPLERYMEPDMEKRLETLLVKYADERPVIDIRDADETEAMALGAVLKSHRYWGFSVLNYRIEDSAFLPQQNAAEFRRIPFPSLSSAELRFLRRGTPFDAPPGNGEEIMQRRDLTRQTVREIRILSRLFRENQEYWRRVSAQLASSIRSRDTGRTELIMDASRLQVPDEALEKLLNAGYLDAFIRKSGIVYLKFPDESALRMLLHADSVPALEIFLETAFIREYGRAAAYHDLTLYGYTLVTGIHRSLPVVIGSIGNDRDVKDIYGFDAEAHRLFGEPMRKVLVKEPDLFLREELRDAAEYLHIEFTTLKQLTDILEPR